MRVALVSEHASPLAVLGGVDAGGQNVQVGLLADGLASLGVEVTVYTRRDDPDLPRRVQLPSGAVVAHVDAGPAAPVPKDDLFGWMGAFAEGLARDFSRRRPQLVHAHFWMSAYASMLAARPLGVPVGVTFHALGIVKRRHQGDADTSPAERLAVEQALVARADRLLATCPDEAFELLALGADLTRLSVVPCGVDLGCFGPAGERTQRVEGLRRVLVVSRLVERKGIADVVRALAEVPGAELVVAGGPSPEELPGDAGALALRRVAEAEGVADRVRLLGRVGRRDLPALYRSADVVACVPWYEPFGIVPLEAMACGVPVVASAVGGLQETVVDGVTGRHVPPRRPDLLAEALREVLDDDAARQAAGRAGIARVRRRYSAPRVAQATLDVYRQVLAGPAVAAERFEVEGVLG